MIHGKNLDKLIYRDSTKKSYNTIDLKQIIKWAVQMSRMIELIQSADIIYEDLNFNNIMI